MKLKKIIFLISFFMFYTSAKSQLELATGGGLCFSLPIEKRDTFSGAQSIVFSVIPKYELNENFKIISSLKFISIKNANNIDASEIVWKTASLGLGGEYRFSKNNKYSTYAIINNGYLFKFGKNVLSQSSSSGISFVELKTKSKFNQTIETGINYQPREFLNVTFGATVPIIMKNETYKRPLSLELSVYYRFRFGEKKSSKIDTAILPEKVFCKNLRQGTLYIIENRKDNSYLILRKAFLLNYNFSKMVFIDKNELSQKLDSFKKSENFRNIFIAKSGEIIYDISRAATNGIIIYNYQMQNTVEDKPFFVRNLTNDVEFESLENSKRIVKKLNSRLYKMCNDYKF